MTYSRPLIERERALEEAFFHRINEKLIEEMRTQREHEADFEALAEHLHLREARTIEALLGLGVRPENVAALVMAPLVAVAWADRSLDNEERAQLLHDEEELGIRVDSPAGRLLAAWLDERPPAQLFETWEAYAAELSHILSDEERARLREDVVGRSKRICGALEKTFLRGGGPNEDERAVVERIETALSGPDGPRRAKRPRGGLDDILSSLT